MISNPPGRLAGLRSWKHSRLWCGYKKDMRVCHKSMAHPLLYYLLHNPRSIVAYSKKGII